MKSKLFFNNTKGDKLCGILSNPTEKKEKPIIILCHGFTSNKNSPKYVKLENILNRHEISTFRFDFYGHGESEGKFEDITISEAVNDILNAIKFLKQSGYSKIGLVGNSFGGIASTMTASKTDDLFILVLISPVSDYMGKMLAQKNRYPIDKWKKNGFMHHVSNDGTKRRLNYSFFKDSINNNGYEAAKKIGIPTLIVHGDSDETVPIEQSEKTSGSLKACRLEIIKGADHRYSKPEDFDKMLDVVSDFIISHSK